MYTKRSSGGSGGATPDAPGDLGHGRVTLAGCDPRVEDISETHKIPD